MNSHIKREVRGSVSRFKLTNKQKDGLTDKEVWLLNVESYTAVISEYQYTQHSPDP